MKRISVQSFNPLSFLSGGWNAWDMKANRRMKRICQFHPCLRYDSGSEDEMDMSISSSGHSAQKAPGHWTARLRSHAQRRTDEIWDDRPFFPTLFWPLITTGRALLIIRINRRAKCPWNILHPWCLIGVFSFFFAFVKFSSYAWTHFHFQPEGWFPAFFGEQSHQILKIT